MNAAVYLLIDLPPGLAVRGDLLGTTWEADPSPTSVHLPGRTADRLDGASLFSIALLPPDLCGVEVALDAAWRSMFGAEGDRGLDFWGDVKAWGSTDDRVHVAKINRAVAVASYHGPEDPNERWDFVCSTFDAVATWFDSVADWLDVLSGRLVTRPNPHLPSGPPAVQAHPLVIESADDRAKLFASPRSINMALHEIAPMTSAEWTASVSHVTSGRTPPLPHLLLRDARAARLVNDTRRAVIDAATACEVALAESLRARPAVVPPAQVGERVKEPNGIMELYERHADVATINAVSWRRLNDRLAGVRNRVAHDGHRPSAVEADRAIEVATALVGEVAPLPLQ